MSLVEEMARAVASGGLLLAGHPVVVMFSGGRDSNCLLDLAVAVSGVDAVSALHVNYGLRESAGGDEEHCRERCRALGVTFETVHATAPRIGNLQAWARDVRYVAAARLAAARSADIAAGHTASDQVETILYRLASSPSRRALRGMAPRDGILIRPLLDFTREQTGAYCTERGLTWRDDESNESDAYARGRVRHRLVPALREIHPGAERNVLALARLLRDEASVLDGLVDAELDGSGQIALSRLRGLPPALGRLVVQTLADQVQGRPTPGSARRLEEILALRERGTQHLDLPGGVRATSCDGMLRFTLSPDRPRRTRQSRRSSQP